VKVELVDNEEADGSSAFMSSEAKSDQDQAAHVEKLRDTWETLTKAELEAVIEDPGAYAPEEIAARIKRAKDTREGLKANGVAATDLTLKLMEKSIKRAEAAAKEQAEQGKEDGSAKFISSDKAGTSAYFEPTPAQTERYNSLRQKNQRDICHWWSDHGRSGR
jgi:D-serine deaminase-like pyridoxal phosphate-dependent protein